MSRTLALWAFIAGIAGLFYLDRDKSIRTSKALWVPLIWFSIAASRSPFAWLGIGGVPKEIPGQLPEGSPFDQILAASLMLVGLIVLFLRRKEVTSVLRASWPIVLYFAFCLFSLLWSDYAAWGAKRWVRALGDVIMVLVIATEVQPRPALRRLFSRVGFILLPISVLLIRYYPELGTGWDPYGELQVFTGVSTNKNVLGDLVYLIGLGALWQILVLVRDKDNPDRKRRLLAQVILVAFGVLLLHWAHCATATGCIIFGAGLMLALSLPRFRRSPAAVHALVLSLALVGGVGYLLGAKAAITEALGRKPDLTGRTEIWHIVLEIAPNTVGGAGFETFWVGPRVAKLYSMIGGPDRTNEAHNGYIEVFLNLGLLGLGFIALLLGQGYLKAVSLFRRDAALGGLMVTYVVTTLAYNVTEAGFRMLSLQWFFLLLTIVMVNRVITLPEVVPAESASELAVPERPRWATRLPGMAARGDKATDGGSSPSSVTARIKRVEPRTPGHLVGDGKHRG